MAAEISNSGYAVLVVEDNLLVGMGLKATLLDEGFTVELAESGVAATELLQAKEFDIVLLDMRLPDATGDQLLAGWRERWPDLTVIFITGHATVEMAVECLKAGAYDFLAKPVERPHLIKTLQNAIRHRELKDKVERLSELSQRVTDTMVMGEVVALDPASRRMMEMASRIAASDFSCVLITGESGTGKGLLARTLHKLGRRAEHPFVEINCAAMPANLVESELFGHVKGSFTDAKTDKVGLFEMADKGTLFLDEIGDMDVGLQAKLLKVMEDQRFRRIGGNKEVKVDVAIVAATNQNIEQHITDGHFRADLYYRLNVLPMLLPPLRERKQDIEQLCNHFVVRFSRKLGKQIDGFSNEAMAAIKAYSWPGNIRELRNVVERSCILTPDPVIGDLGLLFPNRPVHEVRASAAAASEISTSTPPPTPASRPARLPAMPLQDAERQIIVSAMEEAGGNRNEAAKVLGIHRTTLYKKLQLYGLDS